MLIWVIIVLLTGAALAVLLRPLLSGAREAGADSAHELAVYRDQLREVDADLERGLIGEAEAEAARAEISRRILAQAAQSGELAGEADAEQSGVTGAQEAADAAPAKTRGAWRAAVIGTAVFVPGMALFLYLGFGSPGMPDMPRAARLQAPEGGARIAALVARVEERLRAHPEDGMGWNVIAPVYLRLGQYDRAADAYDRAIRILGENTDRLAGLAEALVLSKNGVVDERARKIFVKVVAADPDRPKARFWLAMAAEQDGNFAEAVKRYAALLKETPKDAPWRGLVAERLKIAEARASGAAKGGGTGAGAQMTARSGPSRASGPMMARRDAAPGPTAEDVAAAQSMSAADRAQMINQMVARLASRLKANGKDLGGWLRLMRAYTVLGKREAALKALADARKNFDGDGQALARIEALAGELGLGG